MYSHPHIKFYNLTHFVDWNNNNSPTRVHYTFNISLQNNCHSPLQDDKTWAKFITRPNTPIVTDLQNVVHNSPAGNCHNRHMWSVCQGIKGTDPDRRFTWRTLCSPIKFIIPRGPRSLCEFFGNNKIRHIRVFAQPGIKYTWRHVNIHLNRFPAKDNIVIVLGDKSLCKYYHPNNFRE